MVGSIRKFDHELNMRSIYYHIVFSFSSTIRIFSSFLPFETLKKENRCKALERFSEISVQILEGCKLSFLLVLLLLTIFNQCSLQFMSNYGMIHIRIAYRVSLAICHVRWKRKKIYTYIFWQALPSWTFPNLEISLHRKIRNVLYQ